MIASQVIANELVKRLKLKSPNALRLFSRRRMFVLSRGDDGRLASATQLFPRRFFLGVCAVVRSI